MTTYDFVHLVLLAFDGSIQGRTKLQKSVYFVGQMAFAEKDLGYGPHYYGPYSSDVAGAVSELRGMGFLEQSTATAGAIDPNGFEVARYDYTLTREGTDIGKAKAKRFPKEWKKIQSSAKLLRDCPASDYVKLSIAAKMCFLMQGKDHATITELVRMTPKFGWRVTNQQMKEAARFLEELGLVSLAKKK